MPLVRNRNLFEYFLELITKRKSKQGTDSVRVDSYRGHNAKHCEPDARRCGGGVAQKLNRVLCVTKILTSRYFLYRTRYSLHYSIIKRIGNNFFCSRRADNLSKRLGGSELHLFSYLAGLDFKHTFENSRVD